MPRYFIEVAYMGTAYSGFQIQENAVTVQQKVEEAFAVFFRRKIELTGSSRTDTGVHALQNFFHVDWEGTFDQRNIYNINSLLPGDIVIKNMLPVHPNAHARFDAVSRHYRYTIYRKKDPFLTDRGWYVPFSLSVPVLMEMADQAIGRHDFIAFSKRNTQVKTHECEVHYSRWIEEEGLLHYEVAANRFLRGMVRGLVGTMVRAARGNHIPGPVSELIRKAEPASADFSAPGKGLFLVKVDYPSGFFMEKAE